MPMSAAMRTEMQRRNRVHPVLELSLEGTTLRYAEESIASESSGLYRPYILRWGDFSSASGFADFQFVLPRSTVTIFDEGRELQKLLAGSWRNRETEVTVKTFWRSFHVSAADHYQDFEGKLSDVELVDDRTYQLTSAFDLAQLEAPVSIPKYSKLLFPDGDATLNGTDLWVLYGRHHSSLSRATGAVNMVPTIIDSNGNAVEWLSGVGDADALQIWVNGTIHRGWTATTKTTYADETPVSLVTFASNKPLPTDTVTCDAVGIQRTRFSVGGPIENPATAIRHFLANLVFGSGLKNEYESETGKPMSVADLDAAENEIVTSGEEVSFIVRSSDTGLSKLNELCQNFKFIPFLVDGQKLGIRKDLTNEKDYPTEHIFQAAQEVRGPIASQTARTKPLVSIEARFAATVNGTDPDLLNVIEDTVRGASNVGKETFTAAAKSFLKNT